MNWCNASRCALRSPKIWSFERALEWSMFHGRHFFSWWICWEGNQDTKSKKDECIMESRSSDAFPWAGTVLWMDHQSFCSAGSHLLKHHKASLLDFFWWISTNSKLVLERVWAVWVWWSYPSQISKWYSFIISSFQSGKIESYTNWQATSQPNRLKMACLGTLSNFPGVQWDTFSRFGGWIL